MDMTIEQAMKVAAELEERGCLNEPAKAARTLLAHINSLASPQVTDEQIAFEQHVKNIFPHSWELDLASDRMTGYGSLQTMLMWGAWQARSRLSASQESVPQGWLDVIAKVRKGIDTYSESSFDNSGYRNYAHVMLDAVVDGLDDLSAPPAAETPKPTAEVQGWIVLDAAEVQSGVDRVRWAEGLIRQLPETHDGRNSWLMNYGKGGYTKAAPQEAETVAAAISTNLSNLIAEIEKQWGTRVNNVTTLYKITADQLAQLTLLSQEQAPASVSALDKEAGECQRIVRTGDQSLTLTFSSCRAANAFEKALRATPPTWAQSQPQQVTKP